MARKERRFDIQKTSYASAPCSAAARAVAQLGFASNSFGTVLAALPLIGAAGFVAVLSEPLSHRLLSFVILGIIPALAVRASGWVLFWALRSASCSCLFPTYGFPVATTVPTPGIAAEALKRGNPE